MSGNNIETGPPEQRMPGARPHNPRLITSCDYPASLSRRAGGLSFQRTIK
jgi:hypothetical protein